MVIGATRGRKEDGMSHHNFLLIDKKIWGWMIYMVKVKSTLRLNGVVARV